MATHRSERLFMSPLPVQSFPRVHRPCMRTMLKQQDDLNLRPQLAWASGGVSERFQPYRCFWGFPGFSEVSFPAAARAIFICRQKSS